ncbi:MAG TPA: S8 family serine peptidase [Solirubrobacteraceae bacterium]
MGPRIVAAAVLALGIAPSPAAAQSAPFVPDEVLVRFEPRIGADRRAQLRREHRVRVVQALPVPGLQLVRLPADLSVPAAIAELEREPGVRYAVPNAYLSPLATPDDDLFAQQWGLTAIDAPQAWDTTTGSPDVTVAIVDSGVAYDHADLAQNIWANPGESGGGKETNGLDDDGNGFVDDFRGWDFLHDDNTPLDADFHGTAVAGVVGGRGDNAREIAGVNWQVGLMPVRINAGLEAFDITLAAIVEGFGYAVDNGADVVNASFGGSISDLSAGQPVTDVITGAPDVLFVAGAGNDGTDNDVAMFYPCNLPADNIVCVAATDEDDDLASFSNYGAQSVDLAAPGTDILTTTLAVDPAPLFAEGFESDISTTWTTFGTNNTWARTNTAAANGSSFSLTDSPAGDYVDGTQSIARNTTGFSLAGRQGCVGRMDLRLDTRTEIQAASPPRDDFIVIASPTSNGAGAKAAERHNGALATFTPNAFDVSNLDGDGDAFLLLAFVSNTDGLVADGVHVDDIAVRCHRTTFPDPTVDAADGTSLATPFVSGAAALLMADEPGLSVAQVKERLLATVDKVPALAGKTVTGGRLNVNRALNPPSPPPDPAGDTTPPPAPPPDTGTPPAPAPFVPPPPAPDLVAPVLTLASSARQRAGGRIVVRARCANEPCRLTAAGAVLGRRLRAATASAGAGVDARLVLRVSRPVIRAIRRALRRRRKVSARITVTAIDAAGNVTTKRRTIRLRR